MLLHLYILFTFSRKRFVTADPSLWQGWAKYFQKCIKIQIQNTATKMYLITSEITISKKYLSGIQSLSSLIPINVYKRLQAVKIAIQVLIQHF